MIEVIAWFVHRGCGPSTPPRGGCHMQRDVILAVSSRLGPLKSQPAHLLTARELVVPIRGRLPDQVVTGIVWISQRRSPTSIHSLPPHRAHVGTRASRKRKSAGRTVPEAKRRARGGASQYGAVIVDHPARPDSAGSRYVRLGAMRSKAAGPPPRCPILLVCAGTVGPRRCAGALVGRPRERSQ